MNETTKNNLAVAQDTRFIRQIKSDDQLDVANE